MKKIVFVLTAAFGLLLGAASANAASAVVQYPPDANAPAVSAAVTVAVGETATYTVTNAQPGEKVTLTIDGVTYEATADANGMAVFTIKAPSTPGTYPIMIHLESSNVDLETSLTVTAAVTTTTAAPTPGGKLPATGAGGTTQGAAFAGALLAAGAALVVVAKRRKATV